MFRRFFFMIIAIAVVGGGAWMMLSSSSPSPDLLSSTSSSTPADQQLVSTLLSLRTVKLDGTIFSDPAFESLKDFSTTIVPEPVGRADPFAPLSDTAAPTASTTKAAQIFTPSGSSAPAVPTVVPTAGP